MKATRDIDDQLLASAKALASQQRLRSAAGPAKAPKPRLPILKGRGGLVAGVNPLSNKALLGALDDHA